MPDLQAPAPDDADPSTTAIRPLRAPDRADWERLWRAYHAFYEAMVAPEIYDLAFERLLSDDPHEFHGLVAERGGALIGLSHHLFHRHGWRRGPVVYLQDLYVDPEARGDGAGRALIEAVYADADARGAEAVYWLTQDFNAPARRLYDQVARVTPFIKYER
ncbi:MAG: GNAT family N-acetyltransferase [Pseudomonadota bacterium]